MFFRTTLTNIHDFNGKSTYFKVDSKMINLQINIMRVTNNLNLILSI